MLNLLGLSILSSILINIVVTSKILAVIPIGARSHYLVYEPLLLELARRGHEVTVVTAFPQGKPVPNFTDIDGSQYLFIRDGSIDVNMLGSVPVHPFYNLYILSAFGNVADMFDIPEVKRLTNSSDEFDLLITELFHNDVSLSFVNKFKAPSIALSSCALPPWGDERFGNPDNPSYIPVTFGRYSSRMSFLQRVDNTVLSWVSKLVFFSFFNYKAERIVRANFGRSMPPLLKIGENTSLVLVNTHVSLHGVRPFLPTVIEIGGINLKPPKNLPQDLEKFINESEHGVIYFCMGSMLRASTLPEEKRRDIIEVFSKLPQRVLWKWETENMPDKPDNVKLAKWMPQRDILAHPNIKLFISHGGLLGVTEAVYSGIPIIGMPFYGDQGVNIEAVKAAGAGLRLDFNDLNKNSLEKTIKEILENPEYKENALQLSIRFKDRPQTPLETAVYWTEYVIRHKGAPHLRSAAVDLAWYQYLLLDVIAFLLVSFIVISLIIFYTFRFIFSYIKQILFRPHKTKVSSNRKNK